MNNEKILYYLGILENGALNYYQTVETIRIASQSIQDYIEQLEEQNKKQKEAIDDYKEDISHLLDIINKNCNELKCTSDEWLVIQIYQDKEVSE